MKKYEETDVTPKWVVLGAGGVVALFAGTFLLCWSITLAYTEGVWPNTGWWYKPLAEIMEHIPPQPRLQENFYEDLEVFVKDQTDLLHSYRWIDREAGTVALPIDRAMEIALQRGYPVYTPSEEGPTDDE